MADAVILLDWYRTLSHSRFWDHWATAGDASLHDAAGRLSRALFATSEHRLVGHWMRGEMAAEDVIAVVAPMAGIDPDLALDGLAEHCASMPMVSAEVLPRVAQLRASGVRVGIATGNMDTFSRWTVPALGLDAVFDPILNSAELGALKADPLDAADGSPFFGAFLAGLA
ncbi:MAG: HAD family hydrolase, partial [Thermomicrobiales bacterium]